MMSPSLETDVVIVGSGPAGLFAIFELGMLGMRCHVVDALEMAGGQCRALYPEKPIYDIPAHPQIDGERLIQALEAQAAPFHPVFHLGHQVSAIEKMEGLWWQVTTSKNTVIRTRAIIIAAGVGAFGPKKPPLPDIEQYEGTSVFYMVRRREDFRDKTLVIAGGGDSALDWTLSLADLARKIYVIHRRDQFRGAPESVARLQQLRDSGKVEVVVPYQLHALKGANGKLDAVVVKNLDGDTRDLPADCLLPFFGLAMDLGPIATWGLALEKKQIVVHPTTCETSVEGIFAIGDVNTYPHKLKLILCGFAEAAYAAHKIRARLFPDQVFHFEYSTTKGVPGN